MKSREPMFSDVQRNLLGRPFPPWEKLEDEKKSNLELQVVLLPAQ